MGGQGFGYTRRRWLRWGGLLGVGLVAGCRPAPETFEVAASPPEAPDPRPTVALVMKTRTNPFFVAMERGARRAERELGVQLLVRTAAQEISIEHQIALVYDLIDRRVDAIVIAPGDSQKLVPVLAKASALGIPVINIDNRLDPAYAHRAGLGTVPFISIDNRAAAELAVARLLQGLTPPLEAAVIEGIPTAANASARTRGALAAFGAVPGVEVVAVESAHWQIGEAYALIGQLLARHPGLKALFCGNDMMALGVIHYLREHAHPGLAIAAFDALPETHGALERGDLWVTVDQRAADQGYLGVVAAVDSLAGRPVAAMTLLEVRLVVGRALADHG